MDLSNADRAGLQQGSTQGVGTIHCAKRPDVLLMPPSMGSSIMCTGPTPALYT